MNALAIKILDVEEDLSLVDGVTKDCADCDPDGMKRVPREACSSCGGTGRQAINAAEVARELRASKKEKPRPGTLGGRAVVKGGKGRGQSSGGDESGDGDLYLEY
jgi:hypothetical protein